MTLNEIAPSSAIDSQLKTPATKYHHIFPEYKLKFSWKPPHQNVSSNYIDYNSTLDVASQRHVLCVVYGRGVRGVTTQGGRVEEGFAVFLPTYLCFVYLCICVTQNVYLCICVLFIDEGSGGSQHWGGRRIYRFSSSCSL